MVLVTGSSRPVTAASSPATRPPPPIPTAGDTPARCWERSPGAPSAARSTTGRSIAWWGSPSRSTGCRARRFEEGIAQAMVAVLASPRFLFRVEDVVPGQASRPHAPIDEYALASRLSYFLWSTMPDEELFGLAGTGPVAGRAAEAGQADAGRLARQGADAELRRPVARGPRPGRACTSTSGPSSVARGSGSRGPTPSATS